MKHLSFNLFTIALAFVALTNVHAQTADEIIAKNIEALGGKEKIQSITSMISENTMEIMGNESNSTTVVLKGKGAKTKSDFNGQMMVQCYTDKGGWVINPMGGGSEATAMPEEQYKAGKTALTIEPAYMDYAAKGNKVELLGKEKLQNADVYKLKVTTADNFSTIYYIDASTYLILKTSYTTSAMDQTMEISNLYSNYEKTDFGFMVPKTTTMNYGDQFSLVTKLKKVEFNKPIDPTIFDQGNMK